jgi:hypothetical protein
MMTLSSARWRARLAPVAAALLLLALCGCGKGKTTVKGTVTWAGQPLKMGMIVFAAADNPGASGSGEIDSKGNYTVNDAPIGDVKVYINLPPKPVGPAGMSAPPPGMSMPADQQPNGPGGIGSTNPKDYPYSLPDKYKSAEATDLKYKLEKSENTINITLTP